MSPSAFASWKEIDALFEEALELEPAERLAFLRGLRVEDQTRAEVEALLQASDAAAGFFADGVGRFMSDGWEGEFAWEPTLEGKRLGPWQIEAKVGRGGMGTVYRAARADGFFERIAALKVLRRGLDTDDLLTRFRAERRILARLQHVGIAALLDGGATDDGRPYLVMEYVEGKPITDYCDRKRLSIEARLQLFVQVCEAVAYAHRHLVVHRDLKPSNVLVAEDDAGAPHVKLLDFGIAKLLDDDEGLTRTGARLLTPHYAAPEQIRGEVVTTATDVYALGGLLYKLLTGRRATAPTGPAAALLRVAEGEQAAPPSAGVVAAPPVWAAEPTRLRRRLRGDLDRITLKALRAEPEQRYATAEALGRDINRHLAGLSVEARPATLAYRARVFIRRHRAALVGAVALLAASAALGVAHTVRVHAERDRAAAAATQTAQVAGFLSGVLERAEGATERAAVLHLIGPAVARADSELAAVPAVHAAVLEALGDIYLEQYRPLLARPLLHRAVALRRADPSGTREALAGALHTLGESYAKQDDPKPDAAVKAFEEAARLRRTAEDAGLAESLLQWSRMLPHDHPEKQPRFEEALGLIRRIHGARSVEVASALHEYYILGFGSRDAEEHRQALDHALEILLETVGEHHWRTTLVLHEIGLQYERDGDMARALPMQLRSVESARRALPITDQIRVGVAINVGATLHMAHRFEEADTLLTEAVEGARSMGFERNTELGRALVWYGRNLRAQERFDEARAALEEALSVYKGQPSAVLPLTEIGNVHMLQGRDAEAERVYQEAVAHGQGTVLEEVALTRLAEFYEARGRGQVAARYRARLAKSGD